MIVDKKVYEPTKTERYRRSRAKICWKPKKYGLAYGC